MSKQGLQKLTDFKELGKLKGEEFKEAIVGLEDVNIYLHYLTDIINGGEATPKHRDRAIKLLTKTLEAKGHKGQADEIKREDYENNNSKIKSYLHNWALKNEFFPSIAEIAIGTKLSRTTIYKHFNNNKLKEANRDGDRGTIDTMRAVALEKLFKIGLQQGDIKALGMFLRLTEDKKDTTLPKVVNNNYLIINDYKISQESIEALSEEKRVAIKNIIETTLVKAS